MTSVPEPALGLPSLKELWLENNPITDAGRLRPAEADHHLALGPKLRNVGLDQWQARQDDQKEMIRNPDQESAC